MKLNQIFFKKIGLRKISIFLCLLLLVYAKPTLAQEVLIDLDYNATLYNLDHQVPAKKNHSANIILPYGDTLSLPFVDDFSKPGLFGLFPNDSLWTLYGGTFINQTFPINPPTVGAVTFDGVNFRGVPYNFDFPNTYGVADSLCSQPIRMDSIGSVEITPTSNVYLSFYYQPQGRGNAPESEDSLFLQFKSKHGEWIQIWSVPGREITNDTAFKLVMIPITDTLYFYKGFQFQFKNYATLSGNLDHWNLDYVKLDVNRSAADSLYNDVAFVDMTPSVLLNYRQMPWLHYLATPSPGSLLVSSIENRISNLYNVSKALHYNYYVQDENGNNLYTPYSPPDAPDNIDPFYPTGYQTSPLQQHPAFGYTFVQKPVPNDSAVFRILNYVWTTPDDNRWNDTVRINQEFFNYYAYDDGSAELGYGLNAVNGKLAYRFEPVVQALPDTLRGVFMYFNRIMTNVGQRTIKINVWGNSSSCPNSTECPGNILYTSGDVTPMYRDWLNLPYFYKFDPPIILTPPGIFYVGWEQYTSDLLNIGFDLNTDSHDKIYYNTTGQWYSSLINGSLMIRPVFGADVPADINLGTKTNNEMSDEQLLLFPNPATSSVELKMNPNFSDNDEHIKVQIIDCLGREILSKPLTFNVLDVSSIPDGFYFIKLGNSKGLSITKKLVIAR